MKAFSILLLSACVLAIGAIPSKSNLHDEISLRHFEILKLQGAKSAPKAVLEQSMSDANLNNYNERNLIEGAIERLNEELRDIIVNGNDVLPPLDPLVVEYAGPLEIDASGVALTAEIRDLMVQGLQWYLVDDVNVGPLRMSLQVTIPRITTTGLYDAAARIAFISHNAGGKFVLFVHRIVVNADVRIGVSVFGGGRLFLRELEVLIDIHDTFVNVDGLTGSPLLNSIINSYVQSVSQEIIQNEMENISRIISDVLFEIIDEILKEFTLDDIRD